MSNIVLNPRPSGNRTPSGWYDAQGVRRFAGADLCMLPATVEEQLDPTAAPTEFYVIRVTPNDGRSEYTFRMLATDLDNKARFTEALRKGLLPDLAATLQNEDNEFRQMLVARSYADDLFPTRDSDFWTAPSGCYYQGRRIVDKPVTIVNEFQDETHGTVYRLKAGDNVYRDVALQDLKSDGFGYLMGLIIKDPTQLFMSLRKEWASRTDADKAQFEVEFLQYQESLIRKQVEAIRFKTPDRWAIKNAR